MSLPESMSRIVVVGTRSHMDEVIDTMFNTGSIHLIDYVSDADKGFTLGTPRPYSPKASERLLKVRSLEKELGISDNTATKSISKDEILSRISSNNVETAEKEIMSALDKKNDLNQKIAQLNTKKKNLELLIDIPIDLDLYFGYKSIITMVGTIVDDTKPVFDGIDCEIFSSFNKKKGNIIAVFGRIDDKDKIQEVLSSHGFSEIEVPNEIGSAVSALARTDRDITSTNSQLENINKEIKVLLEKHKDFLRASEEELSIEVQKGEIPVRIATSQFSFVIDAWVPQCEVESVKNELESNTTGIYVEIQETRGRSIKETDDAETRFKNTPTKFDNGKIVKEFEYPTKLVSVPKYQEIDPSILVAIFLPLFFGLMVGDVGYAIPFILLGAYGLSVTHNKDWRAIATVLFFGGIWAFVFGFFFFGECLGMHFVTSGHMLDVEYSWQMLLGLNNLPSFFNGILPYGSGVGKLFHVGFLLKLSVYIGIIHLMMGYICALYNRSIQYGFKRGFLEKGGWIFVFVGLVLTCYALSMILIYSMHLEDIIVFFITGVISTIVGVLMNIRCEGIQAVIELPGVIGNILSYTRLAAIGMSKAGMALAFNYIAIGMVACGIGGAPGVILGLVLFAFLHLMVWTLAILSAGLHGLRLQMVELMSKFFEGGGIEYDPLIVKRKKTFLNNKKITGNKEV